MKNLPTTLLLAMGLLSSAHAATVRIDFGTTNTNNGNGTTSPGWNNITTISGTSPVLTDTTGASTGFTLTIATDTFNAGSPANEVPKPPGQPFPDTATGDSFFGVSGTMTLNNLDPLQTYDITLYGFLSRDTSRNTNVTIGGTTQSYQAANLWTSGSNAAPVGATNPNGGGTTFTGLIPLPDGTLPISLARGTGNTVFFIVGVMEVTSVPEPSTALLSSLALIPLLRRRR